MYKLQDFPLAYESLPTDDLLAKISRRTRSAKLKATNKAWIAQVKINIGHQRLEISEVANTPQEALVKLDHEIEKRGLYVS